jgi:hypothetical protein
MIPSSVEREKPRGLSSQVRAEANFAVIHRKVHNAASKLKQLLASVPISFVLFDRILNRLLG